MFYGKKGLQSTALFRNMRTGANKRERLMSDLCEELTKAVPAAEGGGTKEEKYERV